METHYELYVKQNNRWILEANFQTHQREEAIEEAKQLGRQGHIQAVKVVREQRNPKSGLTRETTIYSTDQKRRGGDGDEFGGDDEGGFGASDPFDDDGGGRGRGRRGGDDDDDDFGGPDLGAASSASRSYRSFADMEVEVGVTNWADMDIPSVDQIENHARKARRTPAVAARQMASSGTVARPMGPATFAVVKLVIVVAISILIAAGVTFVFQRMGLGR